MTLNKNSDNALIETDNKSLNPDLVKNLKKKFLGVLLQIEA